MKIYKAIIYIILVVCTLLFAGCNNWWDDAEMFRGAFERLKAYPAAKFTIEEYSGNSFADLNLVLTSSEWYSGEDFWRRESDGDEYLRYSDCSWVAKGNSNRTWEYNELGYNSYAWWTRSNVDGYLKGQSLFVREGEDIIFEKRSTSQAWNETKRRGTITTFYMTGDWEIYKIISSSITFKGSKPVEEEIEEIKLKVYQITLEDPEIVENMLWSVYLDTNK